MTAEHIDQPGPDFLTTAAEELLAIPVCSHPDGCSDETEPFTDLCATHLAGGRDVLIVVDEPSGRTRRAAS